MTEDIVTALRALGFPGGDHISLVANTAADEIVRLREQVAELSGTADFWEREARR